MDPTGGGTVLDPPGPVKAVGMPLARYEQPKLAMEDTRMRRNGIDKLALLVALGAIALVVIAAAGTAPAYSEASRTDPAATHRATTDKASPVLAIERSTTASASESMTGSRTAPTARQDDAEGYQWSGSRPADQRYLWSQGTS
jgi:hypothetical protein